MNPRILFIFFIFLGSATCYSQQYSEKVEASRMTLGGVSRDGFKTSFVESAAEIRKSWWRYAKEFGRPLNMKSYYQVTIPSTENSGNIDITLISKSSQRGTSSEFFLALDDQNIPSEKQNAYNEQVRLILIDFKTHLFVKEIEEQIRKQENLVEDLSKKVENEPLQIHVNQLMKAQDQLEDLKGKLNQVF